MKTHSNSTGQDEELDSEIYARRLDKHDEEMIEVQKRIGVIENKFGTNEKIADTLWETAEKATRLEAMLAKVFVRLLQKDTKTQDEIQKLVGKSDRHKLWLLLKGIGFVVWSIALIVIGALINKYIGGK